MNPNQLTQKSIEAIQAAQRMAQERNHTQIQQATCSTPSSTTPRI